MHKKRVLSTLVAIPIVYLFVLWGGLAYFLFLLALAIMALGEFFRMSDEKGLPSVEIWALVVVLMMFLNAYLITSSSRPGWLGDFTSFIIFLSVAGLLLILTVGAQTKEGAVSAGITLLGIFYVGWLLVHAVFLREMKPFGYQFTLVVVISTWLADASAFYIGGRFGRKPLHPASPNKSRIGALASLPAGALAAAASVYLLGLDFITLGQAMFLGALLGAGAVLGDLCESTLKRNFGQKNSGKFLPGHGGVLDRLDSFLFTLPIMYYCMRWVFL